MPGGPAGPGGLPPPGVGAKRSFEDVGGDAAAPEAKRQEPAPLETVLRLLVPVRRVGAIIGKHGAVIKEVRMGGARAAVPGCGCQRPTGSVVEWGDKCLNWLMAQ